MRSHRGLIVVYCKIAIICVSNPKTLHCTAVTAFLIALKYNPLRNYTKRIKVAKSNWPKTYPAESNSPFAHKHKQVPSIVIVKVVAVSIVVMAINHVNLQFQH